MSEIWSKVRYGVRIYKLHKERIDKLAFLCLLLVDNMFDNLIRTLEIQCACRCQFKIRFESAKVDLQCKI